MDNKYNSNLPAVCQSNIQILKREPGGDGDLIKEQIGLEVVRLLSDGVRTGLKVLEGRHHVAGQWELVRQKIALMDKEGEAQIRLLEQELAKAQGRTERLQSLLDFYAGLDSTKSSLIAASIGKAIEQLTME